MTLLNHQVVATAVLTTTILGSATAAPTDRPENLETKEAVEAVATAGNGKPGLDPGENPKDSSKLSWKQVLDGWIAEDPAFFPKLKLPNFKPAPKTHAFMGFKFRTSFISKKDGESLEDALKNSYFEFDLKDQYMDKKEAVGDFNDYKVDYPAMRKYISRFDGVSTGEAQKKEEQEAFDIGARVALGKDIRILTVK